MEEKLNNFSSEVASTIQPMLKRNVLVCVDMDNDCMYIDIYLHKGSQFVKKYSEISKKIDEGLKTEEVVDDIIKSFKSFILKRYFN